MLKKNWQRLVLAAVVVALGSLVAWHWFSQTEPAIKIAVGGQTLNVLLADTPARRWQGLSDRIDLGLYDGMLFIFPEPGYHTMVMRQMQFPLDFIWLREGRVVDIIEDAPLEPNISEDRLRRYSPRTPADMVLELSAGLAKRLNLKISDTVSQAGQSRAQ